jgi:hypothetical protein
MTFRAFSSAFVTGVMELTKPLASTIVRPN